jgi:uncharacterized protein YfaP (DUF2135 family)
MLSTVAFAQAPQIKSGATVYIEPMDGYETYLAAAIAKKNVPLVVVADKGKADYFITSSVSQKAPVQPAVVINDSINNVNNGSNNTQNAGSQGGFPRPRSFGQTSASISVIDSHSSQIVFAYSVGKRANTNQLQSTAEACAKHLKEFIEKPKK